MSRARQPAPVVERMQRPPSPDRCEFCGREQPLSFHHLIPVKNHRKPRFRNRYSLDEMRNRGLYLCGLCHSGIHNLIPDEMALAEKFSTKELLLAHEPIVRHVAWVAKQK